MSKVATESFDSSDSYSQPFRNKWLLFALLLLAALLGGYGAYRATTGEHPTAVEAGLLVQGAAIFFVFAFVLVAKAYTPRVDELRVTADELGRELELLELEAIRLESELPPDGASEE